MNTKIEVTPSVDGRGYSVRLFNEAGRMQESYLCTSADSVALVVRSLCNTEDPPKFYNKFTCLGFSKGWEVES